MADEMTQSQLNKVQHWFSNMVVNKACESCGTGTWKLSGTFATLPIITLNEGEVPNTDLTNTRPMVTATCSRCGHTRFYSYKIIFG